MCNKTTHTHNPLIDNCKVQEFLKFQNNEIN